MKISLLPAATLAVIMAAWATPAWSAGSAYDENWPQWRGPLANGVGPAADPPLVWSETKNIRWKVRVPGEGSATPIVWGARVFVLTAVPPGPGAADMAHQFTVMCLDRATGKTIWQKVANATVPHEGHHQDHGYASASPVTDGKLLYAHFGSRGLHCYDLDGNFKWKADFGQMQTKNAFGEATSPVLSGQSVIINWAHLGPDFIVALDRETGRELWRTPQEEDTTWSTPLVVSHEGRAQVIVNATLKARSFDVATGKLLWECAGQTVNAIPSPVAANGVAYLMSGFRGNTLQAIKLGRTGDLTGTDAIVWSHNKSTPYVPSPLLYDGLLYFIGNNNNILSCFEATTGKPLIDAERLNDLRGIYASPVGAKNRVYVLDREGKTVVLKKGPAIEVLATNSLNEKTDASIAMVGREIFIRGHESLYCIAEP